MVDKKDFYIPCSFEGRRPCLLDQGLFIPPNFEDHEKYSSLSLLQILPKKEQVFVELCSGNGQWILEKAAKQPEVMWVAVEMKFARARNIWVQMKRRKLSNVFLIFGEAFTFLQHYVSNESVDQLFINFPDPWPKARHAKNRLIQKTFVEEAKRVLKNQAPLFFVSDHKEYKDQAIEVFQKVEELKPAFASPYYVTKWDGFGGSYFYQLFKKQKQTIYYVGFEKNAY